MQPTAADVRALAARFVSDELVIVPIRHHSPACARAVRQAFEAHRPSRILIEGPRAFTDLIPQLLHPEARQPLAIYGYVREQTAAHLPDITHGAFIPFCDHSPELVAAQLGREAGVPVEFCDLDHVQQVYATHDRVEEEPGATTVLVDEGHYGSSDGLQELARRMGCQDHDDLWELLVESTEVRLTEHLARMAAYCLLARRDATAERLAADGTRDREAEMAHHVAVAVAERAPGDGPVLLVQGGFHSVALPDQLAAGMTTRPTIAVPARAETGSALVRYDFPRLDQLSGYASGMTSPAWHQSVWERTEAGQPAPAARREAALALLLEVADELRRAHRRTVSTPALTAAYEQALRLASLRGRPAPLRSDVVDAVTSCFIQGDADTEGVLVRSVTLGRLRGDAVGVLPPGASTPPLVRDTMERLRARRFDLEAPDTRTVNLDIWRSPDHRRVSRILHGLVLLGVPFARHTAGPDFVAGSELGRLQERWDCRWSPMSEGALVEASRFGATLPEAVAVRFGQLIAAVAEEGSPSSRRASSLLGQSLVLGLHDRTDRMLMLVRTAVSSDPSFADVTSTLGHLALLREGREPLEAHRLAGLDGLVQAAYERAIYLGRDWQGDEVPPDLAVDALARLRELLASPSAADLDPEPYWAMVHRLRVGHDLPLVRGAAAGLAYAAGQLDAESLGRDVVGHLASSLPPDSAVAFVRGLLGAAREATWQENDLMPTLDRLIAQWPDETFVEHLPELRLAFSRLTPAETDRVAALVAGMHGKRGLGPLRSYEVDEHEVATNLAASATVAGLLTDEGLGEWVS